MGTRQRVVQCVVFLLLLRLGVLNKIAKLIALAQNAVACAQEFQVNACKSPIPFLKEQCAFWKICMDSDASHIAKTKVIARLLAELLGELVEGFFDRLSLKTCVSAELVILLQNYIFSQIFFSFIFVFRNWRNRS